MAKWLITNEIKDNKVEKSEVDTKIEINKKQ